MIACFFGTIFSCIGCLAITDCNQKRKNKNMDLKLHKEMRKFQYVLMKQTRNIKDKLIKNMIINSEIDNFKFKTKYHQVIFSNKNLHVYEYGMNRQVAGGENDYYFAKYKARDNLKRRMMDYHYYESFGSNKMESVVEFFNTAGPFAKEGIYHQYKELIVAHGYEKNMRLLRARNKALQNFNPGMYGAVPLNPSPSN